MLRAFYSRIIQRCRAWRLWREQAGAEVVQFAVVIPIVVGLVWFGYEIFQLATLRAGMRDTVSQAAHYLSSYAAPSDEIIDNPTTLRPAELCAGLNDLVGRSLALQQGNMGDAVTWTINIYKVLDPMVSTLEGNLTPVVCEQINDVVRCNEQFVVVLNVSVPWRKIVFGMGGVTRSDLVLNMSDMAVGVSPCLPYLNLRGANRLISEGPGGCMAEVCWLFEGSFIPERLEIYRDGEDYPVHVVENPLSGGCATIPIPAGETTRITLKAISGKNEVEFDLPPLDCMTGGPDATPTP